LMANRIAALDDLIRSQAPANAPIVAARNALKAPRDIGLSPSRRALANAVLSRAALPTEQFQQLPQ
jgi:hypothetical protein